MSTFWLSERSKVGNLAFFDFLVLLEIEAVDCITLAEDAMLPSRLLAMMIISKYRFFLLKIGGNVMHDRGLCQKTGKKWQDQLCVFKNGKNFGIPRYLNLNN